MKRGFLENYFRIYEELWSGRMGQRGPTRAPHAMVVARYPLGAPRMAVWAHGGSSPDVLWL